MSDVTKSTRASKPRVTAKFGKPNGRYSAEQPTTPMVGAGSLMAFQVGTDGKRELIEAICVRVYFNERGNGLQPVRACVWIKAPRASGLDWATGRGSAGGCGYHKESSAIADAVSNAGVLLFGDPYARNADGSRNGKPLYFGGTGSSGYEIIFKAIAKARGFRGPMSWVSHAL